jgi:hypothetical protein
MQNGERFITKIDAIKKEIEARHIREFNKLYRRIGNDLINIVTNSGSIDFKTIIQNYKPDYIYIFRRIFQDAKEVGMGFEIREQFNFNKRNIIELKSVELKSVEVPKEEQDKVNNKFDILYTLLVNNKTEQLANDDFIQSEATYFENTYKNAQGDYTADVNKIKEESNKLRNELLFLAGATLISEIQKRKTKQKRLEVLDKQLERVQKDAKTETVKKFKNQLEKKIPIRSQSNAEYGTGKASGEIRNAEYQAVKESGASEVAKPNIVTLTTGKLLIDRVKKIWWEKSQFIRGAKPRDNHRAISGSQSNEQGNFFVSYYEVPHPRHESLPASESVHCRCEVEYVVS